MFSQACVKNSVPGGGCMASELQVWKSIMGLRVDLDHICVTILVGGLLAQAEWHKAVDLTASSFCHVATPVNGVLDGWVCAVLLLLCV